MERSKSKLDVNAVAVADSKSIVLARDDRKPSVEPAPKKKKHGALHLLKVAMFMLRRSSKGKKSRPLYVEVPSADVLNKVVGSMRPFHVQGDQSPLHASAAPALPSPQDQYEDVPQMPASMIVPPSPDHASTSSSSDGATSRYASALNLQELDNDDDDDEDNDQNKDGGDEMIDLKAEEFIAQFYQQMRIQNHNEMIRRQNKHHRHH